MHYFQFNIADYRSATNHLSNDEDLAYRRLLDMYYDTEQKIPLDTHWVARRLRMDTQVVEAVLADMFKKHEDGWFHARCEEVIQQYKEFAEAGKRGAAKRWGNKGVTPPNGEANSPPTPPPIATNNYKPITSMTVSKDTVRPPTGEPEERKAKKLPGCDHKGILALYHETLPNLLLSRSGTTHVLATSDKGGGKLRWTCPKTELSPTLTCWLGGSSTLSSSKVQNS